MAKKKKGVIVEIGGYLLTAEHIAVTDNRNNDLMKFLTWASTNMEIVDDDKDFAKEIISFTRKVAKGLISDGEDETYANAWKDETIDNIKKTYKDAVTLVKQKKSSSKNMIMCFEDCDITLPFSLSDDYRADIIKAMEYITSQPDVIEGDMDFALELKERVSLYAKEMITLGTYFPKDKDWNVWKERLCANVDKSLAVWKVNTFKIYDLTKRTSSFGEVRVRLQNLHSLFLEKIPVEGKTKKTYVYRIEDYKGDVVVEFKTMRKVYDYELELSTRLLEMAKGA